VNRLPGELGHPVTLSPCGRRPRLVLAMAGTLLGRVNTPGSENFYGRRRVVAGMRQIADAHVAEPGLAVVEVAAADDETALAIQELLTRGRRPPPVARGAVTVSAHGEIDMAGPSMGRGRAAVGGGNNVVFVVPERSAGATAGCGGAGGRCVVVRCGLGVGGCPYAVGGCGRVRRHR
jgi:hypothetical protein